MKKIIVSLILLTAVMLGAQAQDQTKDNKGQHKFDPEKMAQMHAQRMSESLLLNEKESAAFIPMYVEYQKAFREVNSQYRIKHAENAQKTDADVDAEIRNNFKKSRAILDLRETWYEKFLDVLSPIQLQKMFEQENNMGRAASEMHFQRGGGQPNGQFDGPRGPRGGQRGERPDAKPEVEPKAE